MAFYDGKTIVISGGRGFLGSHISRGLSKYDCEISAPSRNDGIDFRNFDSCLSYLRKTQPDIVFNCAGDQGGVRYYESREGSVYLDNLMMGAYLMEAARLTNVKKYINIVPNCAYPGYLQEEVISEEDFWNGQLHKSVLGYGFSKKASVVQGWAYATQYGFESIHLILTNMYGPGDHFDPKKSHALAALLLKFYEAKRNNFPSVEVWGTGEAIREWLYVQDAAEGIILAGEKYDEVEPLNIAVGDGISISELSNTIKDLVGYEGQIVYNKNMPSGALRKVLSTAKMKEKLGWSPKTGIEKGIKETLSWLEQNYDMIQNS